MLIARLARDRTAAAAIEFGLILPIMVLLVLGLVDTVRRNLAMIDVDAAASLGADLALRRGFEPGRIAAAMAAQSPGVRPGAMTLINCDGDRGKGNSGKAEAKASRKAGRRNGRKRLSADGCTGLPGGRYVRIAASTRVASPFGPERSPRISAIATVRMP